MSPPYEVFVSYARDDQECVRSWVDELKNGGVSVFFDTESLVGGSRWQNDIAEAIHGAKIVVVFVSRASVVSEFVPKELALSVDMKKTILPIILEETEVRGQVAFCIAGLQRVEAYDHDLRKVWGGIQASLQHAGIIWRTPSRRLNEVRREGRDVALDEGTGNVRIRRETPAPPAQPAPEMPPPAERSSWLRAWLLLMASTAAVALFFWFDGVGILQALITSSPAQPPPAEPPKALPVADEDAPPAVVPKALPLDSLEEEAAALAKAYYAAASSDPLTQTGFLAEQVNYLGHVNWSVADVKADLTAYSAKWPRQQMAVLEDPAVRVVESGRVVECDVRLRSTSENAVVRRVSSFTGRLRMAKTKSGLKIVEVAEVAGTRESEPVQFLVEGQKQVAEDFIIESVNSGSSDSGRTSQDIAAMYTDMPDYFGSVVKRDEILTQTQNLITRWPERSYQVTEEPEVTSGLGTPEVEVKVGLEYRVSSPTRGKTQGWVRSIYIVHFNAEGAPLIQKHAEVERGSLE